MLPLVLDITARKTSRPPVEGEPAEGGEGWEIRLDQGPWTPFSGLEGFELEALRRARSGGEGLLARRMGESLAQALVPAGWAEQAPRLLEAFASGRPARLRIRAADPGLLLLPWELLPLGPEGRPLGEQAAVQLAWEGSSTQPRSRVASKAAARGAGTLLLATTDAENDAETDALVKLTQGACRAGGREFLPARDLLAPASLESLDRHLRVEAQHGRPVVALHLVAGVSAGAEGPRLDLREPDGQPGLGVGPAGLQDLLSRHAGALRLLVLLAVEDPTDVPAGGRVAELALAAHRAGVEATVGCRWALSREGARIFSNAFLRTLIGEAAPVAHAVEAGRAVLWQVGRSVDAAALFFCAREAGPFRPLSSPPWPGLLPYAPHEAPFFAGRERGIGRVMQALAAQDGPGRRRFLVLTAAPGSGLTSLVMAGLVPRLLATAGASLVHLRPGPGRRAPVPPETGELLLVVDDMEELFTRVSEPAERDRFLQSLWAAAEPGRRTRVLLLLRADLLARCSELSVDEQGTRLDRVLTDDSLHLLLPVPDPLGWQQMIEMPAERAGLSLEAGLAKRIVEDLGQEREPMPRLGALLSTMWADRQDARLTHALYERAGRVSGALPRRFEAVVEVLDDNERQLCREILLRMVTPQAGGPPVLHRLSREDLLLGGDLGDGADTVLRHLVETGLLIEEDDETDPGPEPRLRLASPALATGWPRLRHWLDEGSAPAPVETGRSFPWTPRRVLAAVALLAPLLVGLGRTWAGHGSSEAALLQAVAAPLEDPTTAAVRLRQLESPPDEKAWIKAARQVLAEPLAAAVAGPWEAPISKLRFRPDGGALLALGGEKARLIDVPSGKAEDVPIERPIVAASFGPDGSSLRLVDHDGTLWSQAPGAAPEKRWSDHEISEGSAIAAFSPSADVVLVVSLERWYLLDPDGRLLSSGDLLLAGEVPRVAAVSEGGQRHVVAGQAGTVLFWNAGDPAPQRTRHPGVRRLRLNAAGTHLLSIGDGRLRLTDLVRGAGVSRTPAGVRVEAAAFDPSGTSLLVDYSELATGKHQSRLLRVDQRTEQEEGPDLEAAPASLLIDPEGENVLRGLADGTIEESSLEGSKAFRRYRGHRGRVHQLALSPDGRWLATAAADGTIRLWPREHEPLPILDPDPKALRAALWQATGTCAGLESAGIEAWCACERCFEREPELCTGLSTGWRSLFVDLSSGSCPE